MNRVLGCVIFGALAGLTVHGQIRNQIYQWNDVPGGPVEPTHYVIEQGLKTVKIKAGFGDPTKRFKFEARTEDWQGGQWVDIGLGSIDLIRVHEDVQDPGDVIVEINGDTGKPGHVYGASDVRWINLPTSQTAYSRLWWVRISGDLGADGMSNFDRIDLVQVGGDLYSGLKSIGMIGNDITISGNQYGPIQGTSVLNVTVEGPGPHSGNITIASTYGRNISIAGSTSGNIAIAGSYTGSITIGADYSGLLSVARDSSGPVSIGQHLKGSIEIGAAADDDPDALIFSGRITVTGDALDTGANHIYIRKMSGGTISCRDMKLTDPYNPNNAVNEGVYIGWRLDGQYYPTTTHTGTIKVNGTLGGLVAIAGVAGTQVEVGQIQAVNLPECSGIRSANRIGPASNIHVLGDFVSGEIRTGANAPVWDPNGAALEGTITIDGSVLPRASIHTDNNPDRPVPIRAAITVKQDFGGTIRSTGAINGKIEIQGNFGIDVPPPGVSGGYIRTAQNQNLTAPIQINGGLQNVGGVLREIEILGALGSAAWICVDFDGFHANHRWESGAVVFANNQQYTGNDANARIYEVYCTKGDLNNDTIINNFDIDPFVLALTKPNEYAQAYPGLAGAHPFHTDLNCDGSLDNFDIDAFVRRLTDPCEYKKQLPDCDPCLAPCPPGEGGEGGLGAQAVADLYKQNVAPERLPAVVQAAADLAAYYGSSPRGQFWRDVHAALTK